MDPVAQRRRSQTAVRVVHHKRIAARGELPADHPVVAADAFAKIESRSSFEPAVQLCHSFWIAVFRQQLIGRKFERGAESVIEIEDLVRKQRCVDGWINIEVWVGGLKIRDVLDVLDTDRPYHRCQDQFSVHGSEQPVEARDDYGGRPPAGLDAEHLEFRREQRWIPLRLRDISVDAFDKGSDDSRAARVIPIELLAQVTAEQEQAIADIALHFLFAQDLGNRAGSLPSPHL